MLLSRLLVNSRPVVVKFLGNQKLSGDRLLHGELGPLTTQWFKGPLRVHTCVFVCEISFHKDLAEEGLSKEFRKVADSLALQAVVRMCVHQFLGRQPIDLTAFSEGRGYHTRDRPSESNTSHTRLQAIPRTPPASCPGGTP